jgi:hypothetical protein
MADSYDIQAGLCMEIHRYDLALNNFRIAIKLYKENENDKENARLLAIKEKLKMCLNMKRKKHRFKPPKNIQKPHQNP